MQPFKIAFSVTFLAAFAVAQAPAMKTFASSSGVAAMTTKAKAERKPGQPLFAQPILHAH